MIIKKRVCPKCGSDRTKTILYGEIPFDAIKKDDILGGCEITPNSPKWHCLKCKNEWGKLD